MGCVNAKQQQQREDQESALPGQRPRASNLKSRGASEALVVESARGSGSGSTLKPEDKGRGARERSESNASGGQTLEGPSRGASAMAGTGSIGSQGETSSRSDQARAAGAVAALQLGAAAAAAASGDMPTGAQATPASSGSPASNAAQNPVSSSRTATVTSPHSAQQPGAIPTGIAAATQRAAAAAAAATTSCSSGSGVVTPTSSPAVPSPAGGNATAPHLGSAPGSEHFSSDSSSVQWQAAMDMPLSDFPLPPSHSHGHGHGASGSGHPRQAYGGHRHGGGDNAGAASGSRPTSRSSSGGSSLRPTSRSGSYRTATSGNHSGGGSSGLHASGMDASERGRRSGPAGGAAATVMTQAPAVSGAASEWSMISAFSERMSVASGLLGGGMSSRGVSGRLMDPEEEEASLALLEEVLRLTELDDLPALTGSMASAASKKDHPHGRSEANTKLMSTRLRSLDRSAAAGEEPVTVGSHTGGLHPSEAGSAAVPAGAGAAGGVTHGGVWLGSSCYGGTSRAGAALHTGRGIEHPPAIQQSSDRTAGMQVVAAATAASNQLRADSSDLSPSQENPHSAITFMPAASGDALAAPPAGMWQRDGRASGIRNLTSSDGSSRNSSIRGMSGQSTATVTSSMTTGVSGRSFVTANTSSSSASISAVSPLMSISDAAPLELTGSLSPPSRAWAVELVMGEGACSEEGSEQLLGKGDGDVAAEVARGVMGDPTSCLPVEDPTSSAVSEGDTQAPSHIADSDSHSSAAAAWQSGIRGASGEQAAAVSGEAEAAAIGGFQKEEEASQAGRTSAAATLVPSPPSSPHSPAPQKPPLLQLPLEVPQPPPLPMTVPQLPLHVLEAATSALASTPLGEGCFGRVMKGRIKRRDVHLIEPHGASVRDDSTFERGTEAGVGGEEGERGGEGGVEAIGKAGKGKRGSLSGPALNGSGGGGGTGGGGSSAASAASPAGARPPFISSTSGSAIGASNRGGLLPGSPALLGGAHGSNNGGGWWTPLKRAGTVEVAVKVLWEDVYENNIEKYKIDMNAIYSLPHPNVARLLAITSSTHVKALVYEFCSRGSVESLLIKCQRKQATFPWHKRLTVALGAAEALAFMHRHEYVHRDFKAANVLLDKDMNAKVAEFGLARGIANWSTHVNTRMMPGFGYIDPYFFSTGKEHIKSDVYSYGVFLVELLTSQLVTENSIHDTLLKEIQSVNMEDVPRLFTQEVKVEGHKRDSVSLAYIARHCLKTKSSSRPHMDQVRRKLHKIVESAFSSTHKGPT